MLKTLKKKYLTAKRIYSVNGISAVGRQVVKKLTGDKSYLNVMPAEFSEMSMEQRFSFIYESGHWLEDGTDSLSGSGSSLEYTTGYRRELTSLIERKRFRRIFDAPCGDFNWMSKVVDETGIEYVGGDIVKSLVVKNKERYGDMFFHFDITKDKFHEADVWHCRDCLVHLSYSDIRQALENFRKSSIDYTLLTTHQLPKGKKNKDIVTGDFRPVDLMRPPFSFPEPHARLVDYREGMDHPRFVGLWHRSQIRDFLDRP